MGQFDWNILIRHGHWITIGAGQRQLNVCARCTGTILGFLSLLAIVQLIEFRAFSILPIQHQLILCVLLAMPAGLDWLSQTFGFRRSTNFLRLTTGFLEGAAVALFSTASASFELKLTAILLIGGAISILGLLGKKLILGRQTAC